MVEKQTKHYSHNFLDKVFLRIDFESNNTFIAKDIKEVVENSFKETSIHTAHKDDLNVNAVNMSISKKTTALKYIQGESEGKIIQCFRDNISLTYSEYINKEELLKDTDLIAKILNELGNVSVKRTGLRYVNKINVPNSTSAKDWREFVKHPVSLGDLLDKQHIESGTIRDIHLTEIKCDSFITRTQYGMTNDNYPSDVMSGPYLIDIDCFSFESGSLPDINITELLRQMNVQAEKIFESIITEKLRKLMK